MLERVVHTEILRSAVYCPLYDIKIAHSAPVKEVKVVSYEKTTRASVLHCEHSVCAALTDVFSVYM